MQTKKRNEKESRITFLLLPHITCKQKRKKKNEDRCKSKKESDINKEQKLLKKKKTDLRLFCDIDSKETYEIL